MLARLVEHLASAFWGRVPALALTVLPRSGAIRGPFMELLNNTWDGLLLVPKRRTQIRKIWRHRYGYDNFGSTTKLWKPKNHIVTCTECGDFHELHTICRACYQKVEQETKAVLENIRNAWKTGVIDKEVDVLYQGEKAKSLGKRIVEVDRPRPLWFAPNLVHKANKHKPIDGPPKEPIDLEVKIK